MIKNFKFILIIELLFITTSLFSCAIFNHKHEWTLERVAGEYDDTYEMGTKIFRCNKGGEIRIEDVFNDYMLFERLPDVLHTERGTLGNIEQVITEESYTYSFGKYYKIYGINKEDEILGTGPYINLKYNIDKEEFCIYFSFHFRELNVGDYFDIKLTFENKDNGKFAVVTFFFLMDSKGYSVYMFPYGEYDYSEGDFFNKIFSAKKAIELIDCVNYGFLSKYYMNFTEQEIERATKYTRRGIIPYIYFEEDRFRFILRSNNDGQYITVPLEVSKQEVKIDDDFYLYDRITKIEFSNISNCVPLSSISFI